LEAAVDTPVILSALGSLGGAGGLAVLVRQVRLELRDRRRMAFLRHVFDQTRSPDALETLVRLEEAERRPLIGRKSTAQTQRAVTAGGDESPGP
jgi:hypothetical protein